jgi:hypothetical protein
VTVAYHPCFRLGEGLQGLQRPLASRFLQDYQAERDNSARTYEWPLTEASKNEIKAGSDKKQDERRLAQRFNDDVKDRPDLLGTDNVRSDLRKPQLGFRFGQTDCLCAKSEGS